MVKDRFRPNDPIPLFLSGPDEETELSGVRKVVSSKVFRKVALVFAAVAIVFAVVSVGNAILFASVTASQVNSPGPGDGSGHSTPAIQSTTSAEAVPGTPLGDELVAAFKSALENTAKDLGNGNPLQAITGARSSQGRESLGAADRHRSRAVSC